MERKQINKKQAKAILNGCSALQLKQCRDFAPDGQWQDATPEQVLSKIEPKAWLASGYHIARFNYENSKWVLTLVEYIGDGFIPYLAMNKEE